MGKLLKFEFRKLTRSKSFYICLAISIVILLISGFSTRAFTKVVDGTPLPQLVDFVQSALSNGSVILISGIFIALFICEDDSYGTIKNIYAKGYSRENVFFSKYIITLVGVLFIAVLNILIASLFGLIFFDRTDTASNLFVNILGQLVVLVAYHSIFVAISSWMKKSGGAIAINIIGTSVVSLVLGLIDVALKLKDKMGSFMFTNYWVDTFFTTFKTSNASTSSIVTGFVGSAIYIAFAILLGLLASKKKEL